MARPSRIGRGAAALTAARRLKPPSGPEPAAPRLARALSLRAGEGSTVLLAAAYHFFLMAAYFILRPLRDEMGVVSGVRSLKYLWLGTLVTSLAVLPPYWRLVARLPRHHFIPIVYRAILLSLVGFFALFHALPEQRVWVARAFYVWVSVFNLFVLSVFWSLMADAFQPADGRRLFGLVAAGGTAGALLGAALTASFARELRTTGLLLVSAALLEVATGCALRLARRSAGARAAPAAVEARPSLRQQWIAGFRLLGRSPYLLGAAGYLFLSTFAASFLYAQRTEIMGAQMRDSAARTAVFGWSDFATQTIAIVGQTLVSARMLRAAGTGITLSVQMVVACTGFLLLAHALGRGDGPAGEGTGGWELVGLPLSAPSAALLTVVLFQVALKGTEYALSKPAREALFTVVSRDEKYQCKSLIDTGLYRAFDQVQIWTYSWLHEGSGTLLSGLGWSLRSCALAAAPVLLAGVVLARWLGRKQSELAERGGAR